jgi:pilus assembly protein Flp/PilA
MEINRRWREARAQQPRDERGASLVEYALLVALIAVVCITAITYFGTNQKQNYSKYNTCVGWAGSTGPTPAACQ